MTSKERVSTALRHREPDRVPVGEAYTESTSCRWRWMSETPIFRMRFPIPPISLRVCLLAGRYMWPTSFRPQFLFHVQNGRNDPAEMAPGDVHSLISLGSYWNG